MAPARWCPGVVRLVMGGLQPARVPDTVIAAIRKRECNGVIELPRRLIKAGDRVRLLAGPFRGHLAIYVGMSGAERRSCCRSLVGRTGSRYEAAISRRCLDCAAAGFQAGAPSSGAGRYEARPRAGIALYNALVGLGWLADGAANDPDQVGEAGRAQSGAIFMLRQFLRKQCSAPASRRIGKSRLAASANGHFESELFSSGSMRG
jgi:hypothetical protein